MAKYHISLTTGRPNKCSATKRACPVGGEHFDSADEARAAYEAGQAGSSLPAPQKKADSPEELYSAYISLRRNYDGADRAAKIAEAEVRLKAALAPPAHADRTSCCHPHSGRLHSHRDHRHASVQP